jgi:hypothetical protein
MQGKGKGKAGGIQHPIGEKRDRRPEPEETTDIRGERIEGGGDGPAGSCKDRWEHTHHC